MKAQFVESGQAFQKQRELDLEFTHRQVGVQFLQALPGKALAVQPEGRAGGAGFQIHQQIGIQPLGEAFPVAGQLVGRDAAQGGDLFGIALRQAVDR